MHRSDDNPFNIAAAPEPTVGLGQPVAETNPTAQPTDRIQSMVGSSEVFLLIKGTPRQPLCGFSANAVAVMDSLGVPYRTFDVLSDESIRDAAKTFAGWPTFPQIYVKGEFIGGNDILMDMYDAGELQELTTGIGA